MFHERMSFVGGLGFAAFLLVAAPAVAAIAPPLGTTASYTVLGANSIPTVGTVTCTNTGSGSTINGNVGSTFTSITNTGCTITGTIDTPVAGTVVTDFNNAYSQLDSLNPTCDGTVPITSATLAPGVYCAAAGVTIGAGVILTLTGTANDVWVFRIGTGGTGALTGNSFQVVMGGTAQACNVFWRTADAATLTDSVFKGTILAGAAITSTRGNYEGRALARTNVTVTNAAPMTGCAAPASITVNKNFNPISGATVSVALTCTSGTVAATPLNASTAAPAVFTVTGAAPGATCTATETAVPVGYTANQANCAAVALNNSCTITNTQNSNTITVNKDFIPNSGATVAVALTCTSGTVAATPQNASEAAPAVFTVSGATPGATCTATETAVPVGYTANQANCVAVALGGTCTITNTQNSNTITVNKSFIPVSGATVAMALTCTSGTVTATPLNASTAAPAVFTVTGATPGATCTATETTVPLGYTANQANCVAVALNGSCTITNVLTPVLPPLTATPAPTLSQWAVILLTLLLALTAFASMRRRNS